MHLPRIAAAVALFSLVGLGAACERIGYYSISGSAAGADGDGPSVAVGSTGTGTGTVTKQMVLSGAALCTGELYAEVRAATAELELAASQLVVSPGPEAEQTARDAWLLAVGKWQQAEFVRLGVAGSPTLPEGQGLRDYVYSWPLTSRCLVEQGLVAQTYQDASFASTALVNMRGLPAAEYLLFYEGSDNGCGASVAINSQGTWAALGSTELAERKRRYAAVAVADVAAKAATIEAAWAGPDGFGARFAASGLSDGVFDSDQAGLNALTDGLFYLEREVKDLKLGRPLGKYECPDPKCPSTVESQYARVSRTHLANNLLGFERLWHGCASAPESGLDDLLRSIGADSAADRMEAELDSAKLAVSAIAEDDLVAALASQPQSIEAAHAAIKKLTDIMKTEFVSVLDLEAPNYVEGDND